MKYVKYALIMLVNCTWGFFQTLAGLIFFLKFIDCPHSFFEGAIVTKWRSKHFSGLSLGLFIFIPDEKAEFFKTYGWSEEKINDQISRCRVHEYGHTIQSLILGPFMLIPGIVSVAWGNMKRYERLRREYHVPYSFCWIEDWANKLGEKATGLPALSDS